MNHNYIMETMPSVSVMESIELNLIGLKESKEQLKIGDFS